MTVSTVFGIPVIASTHVDRGGAVLGLDPGSTSPDPVVFMHPLDLVTLDIPTSEPTAKLERMMSYLVDRAHKRLDILARNL